MLVVDDESDARRLMGEFLEGEGYEVRTAENGRAALTIIERFKPDIVLTDLQMPDLDGISVIEQGREVTPHTAFVVMTGHASIHTAVQAIKRGADNYLTKPLDLNEVSAVVARLLEKVELSKESTRLRERVGEEANLSRILGNHPSMLVQSPISSRRSGSGRRRSGSAPWH